MAYNQRIKYVPNKNNTSFSFLAYLIFIFIYYPRGLNSRCLRRNCTVWRLTVCTFLINSLIACLLYNLCSLFASLYKNKPCSILRWQMEEKWTFSAVVLYLICGFYNVHYYVELMLTFLGVTFNYVLHDNLCMIRRRSRRW